MYAPNPLRSLFDVFGHAPESHADGVNRKAAEQLVRLLDVDPATRGRCILLRAPRAGYGKTHLLSQVAGHFGPSHEFVLLTLADGSRMHPGSVLEDLLRRLCRPLPAAGGLTELDLVARRVLALGLEPLVRSGEVPCQDRDSALVALRDRATETFDFHHPNAVTAHWARENFAVLGPRLGLELSQRVGAPLRESVGWVEAFYRFAAAPADQPARIGALIEAAGGGASLDRLGALLQMLTALGRVVLVADELEGLSSDSEAALRLAAFITSLRQTAESVDVVVALNRDLWDSAFLPRLSGGLEDRLAEWVIELAPMSHAEVVSLIDSRVPGRGEELAGRIDLEGDERYARNVLRRAAELWEEVIEKEGPQDVPEPVPFGGPAPAAETPVTAAEDPSAPEPRPFQDLEEPTPTSQEPESAVFLAVDHEKPASAPGEVEPPAFAAAEHEEPEAVGDEWDEPGAKLAEPKDDLDEPGVQFPDAEPPSPMTAGIPEPRPPERRVIEPNSPFRSVGDDPSSVETVDEEPPGELDDEDQPAPGGDDSDSSDAAGESSGATAAGEPPAAPEADSGPEVPEAPPPAAPPDPAEASSESDRVDELLRQFRERYGRK